MEFEMPEIIHHSQLINDLLDAGKIALNKGPGGNATFHDPCYLGRHNGIYDQPRKVIGQAGMKLKEMKESKSRSFCCGGGGSLMWAEEDQGERVNHFRTDDVLGTGVDTVCTSCPFCTTMLTDGITDKGKEETVKVKDIAEIIAEKLK